MNRLTKQGSGFQVCKGFLYQSTSYAYSILVHKSPQVLICPRKLRAFIMILYRPSGRAVSVCLGAFLILLILLLGFPQASSLHLRQWPYRGGSSENILLHDVMNETLGVRCCSPVTILATPDRLIVPETARYQLSLAYRSPRCFVTHGGGHRHTL